MIIKVCGMREEGNIREVEILGVDWMGFIFYPKSPRYVGALLHYKPVDAKRVGVFVNEEVDRLLSIAEKNRLEIIQLHGDESPDVCKVLQEKGFSVIKAFGISKEKPLLSKSIKNYEGCCDYFLFDTRTALHGGSGKKFDWELLTDYKDETPFLLSGGISPDDVAQVNAFSHPKCIGIDLNSGFEISPAVKDVQALQTFLQQIQKNR